MHKCLKRVKRQKMHSSTKQWVPAGTQNGERGVDGMILNRVLFIKIFTWQQCEWWDELKMLKCRIHLPALAGQARPTPLSQNYWTSLCEVLWLVRLLRTLNLSYWNTNYLCCLGRRHCRTVSRLAIHLLFVSACTLINTAAEPRLSSVPWMFRTKKSVRGKLKLFDNHGSINSFLNKH